MRGDLKYRRLRPPKCPIPQKARDKLAAGPLTGMLRERRLGRGRGRPAIPIRAHVIRRAEVGPCKKPRTGRIGRP